MIINVCAQKKLQYLPASLNTLWVIIILTNRLSLLLLFVSKLISISVEIPFGTFLNLVSMIFQRRKIRKLVQRERLTLPNKLFIVGYDATEFMTSSKMGAILTATILEPISRQKKQVLFWQQSSRNLILSDRMIQRIFRNISLS